MPPDRRLAALRERDFRRFFLGYTTSLLGSAMASIALTFAVLESGGGGTRLGWVMAARILPLVLMLLVGGVVGDRLGSRQAMLAADAVRCLTQLGLVAVLLDDRPHLWTLVGLVALSGAAEALFTPALGALVPHIVRPEALSDANSLLEMTRSATSIAGPVLAGLLTAVVDASTVLALDAASYAVSMVVLLLLPRATRSVVAVAASFFGELTEGWTEFRSRTWLWVTTVHICLFNLFVWGPLLVLGPVIAERRLGGAASWGLVMALYGVGAVAGGVVMLGRLPRRPLLVATVATSGWSLPSAALATGRSLPWVCATTLVAGAGSAVCGTLYATATQRQVPPGMLARANAYASFGAFALGPIGLAAAGPISTLLGAPGVLGFGAVWQVAAVTAVLTLPSIRAGLPLPSHEGPHKPPGRRHDGEHQPSTPWTRAHDDPRDPPQQLD
ncbi:MFS transporter [Streptomyces sp. NRRL B-24720]|uniref:MFS transporter n=1 Tax=Streptomyces sp. NRRL B-24720 TaxID=1476876 RepID=UPI0007C5AB32|nr:MFS transporter [Streptomyces sp. NRRL B-24720]